MFLGLPNKGSTFGMMDVLVKAFGVTEIYLRQIFEGNLDRIVSTERKTRSDKDRNFFNCNKKIKLNFTTLSMYI